MARKFDAEDLLAMVLDIMSSGGALNAKIAEVEAEKAALSPSQALTPTLAPIVDYHLQSWSEKILQTTPSIFYGIENIETRSEGNASAKTYTMFVEVVMVDSGNTNDFSKRVLRYARALEELFQANFAPAIAGALVKIENVVPAAFKILNTNDEIKVGGVSLKVTLV